MKQKEIVLIFFLSVSPGVWGVLPVIDDLNYLLLQSDQKAAAQELGAWLRRESESDVQQWLRSLIDGSWTPLSLAASSGSYEIVELLLHYGAPVNTRGCRGNTALNLAISGLFGAIVELLLNNGASALSVNQYQFTPMHEAIQTGSMAVMKPVLSTYEPLLEYTVASGWPLLHWAVFWRKQAGVKLLLEHNAPVGAISSGNELNAAALHWAVDSGNVQMVQILLDNHAPLDLADRYGDTALHWAIERGDRRMAEMLLSYGANIHVLNDFGESPMTLARKGNHFTIIQMLEKALIAHADLTPRPPVPRAIVVRQPTLGTEPQSQGGNPDLDKLMVESPRMKRKKKCAGFKPRTDDDKGDK